MQRKIHLYYLKAEENGALLNTQLIEEPERRTHDVSKDATGSI